MHCPACGKDNRAEARFCDGCGAAIGALAAAREAPSAPAAPSALAAPRNADAPRAYTPPHLAQKIITSRAAIEGERKQVTVLFCDMARSTELARQRGAEAMHGTLNAFFELALAEVHRVEGTINQFLGDGFMALFGAPLAHEDHVRRALHCALAIRQRLHAAAATTGSPLAGVQVRIGLNTGPVVVGRIGDNLRMDYTAIGDTTNLAARLQAQASAGGIAVSEAVRSSSAAHFEFTARGAVALKGIGEAVPVYELQRARPRDDAAPGAQAIGSPLVGRDAEMATLRDALDGLTRGRGALLIIEGDPGTGKSRLVAEARRRFGPEPRVWLEGRCLSFGRHLSYWPFIEILKRAFAIADDDSEPEALAKLERGLMPLFGERCAEMLPYLATMLALPVRPEHEERLKYLDGPGLKRQVFLCTRQLVEAQARLAPLVLLLEDWHWADQSSAELAEHLLPLGLEVPLLLIVPTRRQAEGAAARLRAAAKALPGAPLREIGLAALGSADSERLVARLVGGSGLPLALSEQILRRTEGNPFFIEEVVRALVSDGALVPNEGDQGWKLVRAVEQVQLPDTLQGLILSRIDRLDDEAKHALKLAAVIGRSFFGRVLHAISDARQVLQRCLDELQQAELIREKQRLPELEYIFKHALVQEAAYGSILAENRRAIHRRVAQAIEAQFADRLDEFASLLAHHYTCAEDWDKAQAYLFKAGDQAGRMAADAEALEHLRHAEAAYQKVYGDRLAPLERATLARKIGAALYGTGHYEQGHAQMREALAHLGLRYPGSRWGVRRAVLRQLGSHLWRRLRARLGWPVARTLDDAVAAEVSTIAHLMAWMDYFLDKERMLLDSLIELRVGELSRHGLAEARGLSSVGFGLMTYGARGLARRYDEDAVAVAQRSGHPSAAAFAWFALGFLDFYDGHWDECEARMARAEAAYRESGDIHRWAAAALMLSWVIWARGDLERAETLTREIVRAGIDAADPQVESWGCQNLGKTLLLLGRLEEAEATLRRGQAVAQRIGAWDNLLHQNGLLARSLLTRGRIDEARDAVAQAEQVARDHGLRLPFDRIETVTAAALLRLAEAERAPAAARDAALAVARDACTAALACAKQLPLWLPLAWRCSGTERWLAGDADGAARCWAESMALAEQSVFPIERALTLLERGTRQRDAAEVTQALVLLRPLRAQEGVDRALQALDALAAADGSAPLARLRCA
jgi:class 3 adenylate cyclase/tetratricopeptide (TPR) repeat protein